MESVRSSKRHGRRGGKFMFEIHKRLCGLCLIGKIAPEHCTTIKAALQKICVGLGVYCLLGLEYGPKRNIWIDDANKEERKEIERKGRLSFTFNFGRNFFCRQQSCDMLY